MSLSFFKLYLCWKVYSKGSPPVVRRLVEKDKSFNQYSAEHGTVTIPHFSKSLLLQDLKVDPDVGRLNASAGSCSFDLLVRLGLSPGQPNESLAEYDTRVPLDAVVSRGNCYCGRISRHGFVFLVSKYFQHVSLEQTATGGTCFILSTTVGRFKCYEIDDCIFIHFDSGTRSRDMALVNGQNLDHILRTARGEFLVYVNDNFPLQLDELLEWHQRTDEPIESMAAAPFYGVPNAVIYMTKSTLQRWRRINEFSYAMLNTVLSVLDGLEEPAEFVSAMKNLPPFDGNFPAESVPTGTVGNLAFSIAFFRVASRKSMIAVSSKGEFSYLYRIIDNVNTIIKRFGLFLT